MANVQVIQRNAHLAGAVKLEYINGREGRVAKATVTAISNTRWGSGDKRGEAATAIQWTLWREMAENAAQYLGKGSHVNVIGRVRNNNYEKSGETVYAMEFTAEELDYLDSRADAEARRRGGQDARGQDSGDDTGNGGCRTGDHDEHDERGQRDEQQHGQASERRTRGSRRPAPSET